MTREWSISDIARLTGTTSRTLRHYDAIGLLHPTSIGENGYRYYNAQALIRLQRIMVLRELGMGLKQIAAVLEHEIEEKHALEQLLRQLQGESRRIARQMESVQHTIDTLNTGDELMAEKMFEGWDNSQWEQEVVEKYGKDAWNQSNEWWEKKSPDEKGMIEQEAAAISRAWQQLHAAGVPPESDEVQKLAARHIEFVSAMPGTPDDKQYYVLCLADMYVEDERFAANYGGRDGAEYLRTAIKTYYGVL